MSCAWTLAWDLGCTLGEGPIWSARDQAVYFVDIKVPAVHRLGLRDGARTSWSMPEMIGWLAERQKGFVAGFQSGFAELDLDPLAIRPIGDPEPDLPGNRANDGKVDPAGRVWAGTMDNAEQAATGSLYRLDPDRSWRRMDRGYRVTNGPAFSTDGRTLYHSDSALRCVYRFDLAPDGSLGERQVFIRFGEDDGYPDGMTTDAEGGLWIAHWGGNRVSRFDPDGRPERAIPLPVSQPTSCVFGGEDLDRLFITSAAIGLTCEPLAGGLFEVDPGVRGLPTGIFAG